MQRSAISSDWLILPQRPAALSATHAAVDDMGTPTRAHMS